MVEKLVVLGSTGSIGRQALEVAEKYNIKIEALTACNNSKLMEEQIRKFHPKTVGMLSETAASDLKVRVADTDTRVLSGIQGICTCARNQDSDMVLNAIVGMAGLLPTLDAIDEGKNIALANKETLVAGGKLVTDKAKEKNISILPVDSEHSAIFQCLCGQDNKRALKKILLTASGGPFFGKTRKELEDVTVAQALKHPNWAMGAKITIDSATMMNKGLEVIEACWLFDVTPEQIEVLVHRQSIIHSMVEFDDNAVIAQMGLPDMKIPIQYALTYPSRVPSLVEEIDFAKIQTFTFDKPDIETFDCLAICQEAIARGGLYPTAANSANEQANVMFRQGRIKFLEIAELVGEAMENAPIISDFTLSDVLMTDRLSRDYVMKQIENKGGSYHTFS